MNAKKTPGPTLYLLEQGAQAERPETDKRLIACEKAMGETVGMTLLAGLNAEVADAGQMGQRLPGGAEEVVERLGGTSGGIAVVVEPTDSLEALAGLLAALRDRANRRIAVHVGKARVGGAIDQQLVSLGYKRQSADEALYLFDIETYKDTPDWLSPRNWANPELWDRFRW